MYGGSLSGFKLAFSWLQVMMSTLRRLFIRSFKWLRSFFLFLLNYLSLSYLFIRILKYILDLSPSLVIYVAIFLFYSTTTKLIYKNWGEFCHWSDVMDKREETLKVVDPKTYIWKKGEPVVTWAGQVLSEPGACIHRGWPRGWVHRSLPDDYGCGAHLVLGQAWSLGFSVVLGGNSRAQEHWGQPSSRETLENECDYWA